MKQSRWLNFFTLLTRFMNNTHRDEVERRTERGREEIVCIREDNALAVERVAEKGSDG